MVQSYLDKTGLYRKYGVDKATATTGGEYRTVAELRTAEVVIDLTTLTPAATAIILSDVEFFPKVRIEEVVLEVHTAATSGGTPTLDVGLIQTDRSTAIDLDGFIAAEVLSGVLDTVGKKIIYTAGVSKAGALIGTTTTLPGHIVANSTTATFTAGKVIVRIKYRPGTPV